MKDRFSKAFEQMIKWEGGEITNDPADPGGLTKWGIDQRSHPNVDIRSLTKKQAKLIYRREYWDRVRGDNLPSPIADVVFDIAVNNGPSRAIKWLQQSLKVSADGHIGPVTIAAAKQSQKEVPGMVALALLHRRDGFYRSIAQGRQRKFLKGWLNRNNDWMHYVGHFMV